MSDLQLCKIVINKLAIENLNKTGHVGINGEWG